MWCPIEPAIHPQWTDVEERSIRWLTRQGLCADPVRRRRLVATRSFEWCARVAPNSTLEGLQAFADWFYYGFILDDELFDNPGTGASPARVVPYLQRLLHLMNHPEAAVAPDPLLTALRDLARRWRAIATADALRGWLDSIAAWFFGASVMISHRGLGTVPSLDDYLVVGPWDRASRMFIAGIEMTEGTLLPAGERDTPTVRALTEAAGTVMTFDNDLFSLRHEADEGAPESNIVSVVANARGLSPEAALAEAVRLRDRVLRLYLTLRDRARPSASPPLLAYLGQLDHYIRGNLDWSLTVPRYHTEAGEPDAEHADGPTDGSLHPPAIPSIAWWWDELA